MKRSSVLLILALILLVGCTPAPTPSSDEPTVDDARVTCEAAYSELPHSLEVLAEQSGEDVDAATPCDNWIESQGEAEFIDFWTTPSKYMPYVVSNGKLEALSEL
ncbi:MULTISPECIES: hypothetical protein [unclassified Microbacterium]|uniref:hypothetical protein n=1 Tax=unclassified Microbacterium TaxID=2609290 RepID=UPI00343F6807